MDMTANPGATMNGQTMKNIRNKTGLTQEELAGLIGYSSAQISRMETGREPLPFWLPEIMRHLKRNPGHGHKLLAKRWRSSNAPRWFDVLMWTKQDSHDAAELPVHA